MPEANDLLRQIERSCAGGGSATSGIIDALNQKPEGRRLRGGITVVETKQDQPGGGGQGVNPYPHQESTDKHDHLRCGLAYETDARDWCANKAEHTAAITPECQYYLTLRNVMQIPTSRGYGWEVSEAMPYLYKDPGKDTGTRGRHLVLRLDGVRWRGVGQQTNPDADMRDAVDRLSAEELAAAQIAAAMAGAPAWLTPGIFLSWLVGNAAPEALGDLKSLPSAKTVRTKLAAACGRVVAAEPSAATLREARAALADGSPMLAAVAKRRRRRAAIVRLHRRKQDAEAMVAVQAADGVRQAAVRADDRRAWLGVPEPFVVQKYWEGEKLAPLPAKKTKRVLKRLRKEWLQRAADRCETEGRKFALDWWLEHEHEVPPIVDEKPNYQRQAEKRAQAPLSAQKPHAISEKGPWPFLEPCGPASYIHLKEIAPCLSGSLVEQLLQDA